MNVQKTVLVVDDEAWIRFNAVDVLEEEGFEALEAANAAEALTILKMRPDIDVMLTDINMAGNVNGLDLARIVAAQRPDIRIVVTSGQIALRTEDLDEAVAFLAKPHRRSDLIEAVGPQTVAALQ